MSKLLLKQTTDGIYHLYFDNPDIDGFVKIGQAQDANFYDMHHSHAVLSDKCSNFKTLFGIIHNEVFEVRLPKEAKIEFWNNVCIFERNDQWCTMVFDRGLWTEHILGQMHEILLSLPEQIKYKQSGYWKYFLKYSNNGFQLSHLVEKKLIVLGTYSEVKETDEAKIIGITSNGNYDIFVPNSLHALQGKQGSVFAALDGVFVWYEPNKEWIFHKNCKLWGKNAVFQVFGNKYGKHCQLWRIEGKFIRLIAEGRWKMIPLGVCIDGMKYYLDVESGLVNFDTPKPTFKKRIMDFFKKS